jgi:hypothetical protein
MKARIVAQGNSLLFPIPTVPEGSIRLLISPKRQNLLSLSEIYILNRFQPSADFFPPPQYKSQKYCYFGE